MKNAIFLAFDDKYDRYARACINSIKRNYANHPQLFVFYAGSVPMTLDFLKSVDRLELIDSLDRSALAADINLGEVESRCVYDKYFAWSDFFSAFDNVLYLDVDTLVLKPLDEMLAADDFLIVPNHEPDASVRVFDPTHLTDLRLMGLLEQDRIAPFPNMDDMCNAGVFVVPRRYRTPEHYQGLIDLTNRYNRYLKYADQSAISIWCKVNEIAYSKRYEFNFQTTLFKSDLEGYDENNIHVLHFSSSRKPDTFEFIMWQRIDRPVRKRLAQLFFQYLDEACASRC